MQWYFQPRSRASHHELCESGMPSVRVRTLCSVASITGWGVKSEPFGLDSGRVPERVEAPEPLVNLVPTGER